MSLSNQPSVYPLKEDLTTGNSIMSNATERIISRGFNLMTGATIIAKLGSAITQVVLGWFLFPEEFALFAAALSVQLIAAGLRDAGVGRYLVQKGEYEAYAYPAAIFALVANGVALLLIFSALPFFSKLYNQPDLINVLAPMALCIPIQAFATIYRCKLKIELRFFENAKVITYVALWQYTVIILGAWVGMGVYSLVLGMIVATSAQFFIGRYYAKGFGEHLGKFTWSKFFEMWQACKWLILSGFLLALGLRGDYFVIGILKDKVLVGYYFFGIQMAAAISVLLTGPLENVFLPGLSQALRKSNEAGLSALRDGHKQLAFKAGAISCLAALVAPELIHLLWHGKWDQSAWVFMGAIITMPLTVAATLTGSYLEAHGHWKARAWTVGQQALVTLIVAGFALFYPKLWVLVLSVVVARLIMSLWQIIYIEKRLGERVFAIALEGILLQIPLLGIGCLIFIITFFINTGIIITIIIKASLFSIAVLVWMWRENAPIFLKLKRKIQFAFSKFV